MYVKHKNKETYNGLEVTGSENLVKGGNLIKWEDANHHADIVHNLKYHVHILLNVLLFKELLPSNSYTHYFHTRFIITCICKLNCPLFATLYGPQQRALRPRIPTTVCSKVLRNFLSRNIVNQPTRNRTMSRKTMSTIIINIKIKRAVTA